MSKQKCIQSPISNRINTAVAADPKLSNHIKLSLPTTLAISKVTFQIFASKTSENKFVSKRRTVLKTTNHVM